MQLTIKREILSDRLADINNIAERKNTAPILSHVLLEADNNGLVLKGTDTEISLSIHCQEVEVIEPGTITVPVGKLLEAVKHQRAESLIGCQLVEGQFVLKTPESTFRLLTLPAEDFPTVADSPSAYQLRIQSKVLHNLLTKVRFAMADQEPRAFLNGLYLHVVEEGKALHAVSSDGHRLACGRGLLESEANPEAKLILPKKAVSELIRLLSRVDEVVTLEVSERQLTLVLGAYRFSTRLIDGTYARYQEVIPVRQENPVLIPRNALIEALQRAKVLLSDRRDGVYLRFKESSVQISGRNTANESLEESLDIVNNAAVDYEIGLNVAYLLQACQNLESESLQLHLSGNSGACLLTGEADSHLSFVIMTMRL